MRFAQVTGLRLPSGFTPKQRLLLTANGNIQRIVSSYFAAPVTVFVTTNHKRHETPVYDRQVSMLILGKQFLLAKSTVYLTAPEWIRKVEGEVSVKYAAPPCHTARALRKSCS